MKMIRSQKGITIVALIITILILLILASIAMRGVKDDGIIEHANSAKLQVERLQAKEKVESILLSINTKKNIYGITTDVTQKFNNIQTIIAGSEYKVIEDGYEFIIQGNNGEYKIKED